MANNAGLQGLIIGKTQYFLFDSDSSSLQVKQYVASMVSHEIAHMW